MRIAAALLAVPVRGDYGYGDYGYGDGDGPLQFDQSLTGAQLVEELLSADADLEFRNVRGSSHLDQCAALFANGHAAGVSFEKDPATGALAVDANGDYMPSAAFAIPDRGVMLSTGQSAQFNGYGNFQVFGGIISCLFVHFLLSYLSTQRRLQNSITTQFGVAATSTSRRPSTRPTAKTAASTTRASSSSSSGARTTPTSPTSPSSTSGGATSTWSTSAPTGFYLNGENVARVPDSEADQDFVSINSVNHESNARYFNRNDHVEIQHALPGTKSRLVIGGVRARKCARARDATPSLRGPVSPVRTSVRARGPPRLPPAGG